MRVGLHWGRNGLGEGGTRDEHNVQRVNGNLVAVNDHHCVGVGDGWVDVVKHKELIPNITPRNQIVCDVHHLPIRKRGVE